MVTEVMSVHRHYCLKCNTAANVHYVYVTPSHFTMQDECHWFPEGIKKKTFMTLKLVLLCYTEQNLQK